MTDTNRVEVEILGQKYVIRTVAAPDYVRQLAGYVEKRVTELRGNSTGEDPARLLALASLYITDELFRMREERNEAERDASVRLLALRDLLDAGVTGS